MIGWPSVPDEESPRWTGGDPVAAAERPAGGAPLFLVHDGTGAPEQVRALARNLSGSATVLALPGFGRPEPPLRTVEGIALRLVRRVLAI
jgi:hypothetical protein